MNISTNENKTEYQAELFANRLRRKYKELRKQMRKNRVSCYRLYDRDIPEVPVSLDLYEFLPEEVDSVLEAARFMAAQNERLSANDPLVEREIKERTFAVLYLYERPYEKADEEVLQSKKASLAVSTIGGTADNKKLFEFAKDLINNLKNKYNVIVSGRSVMKIYPDCDYKEVINNFCLENNLDGNQYKKILDAVRNKIENLG